MVPHGHRHAHRRDPQDGPAVLVPGDPRDVELPAAQEAVGDVVQVRQRRPCGLPGTVGVLLALELGEQRPARLEDTGEGQPERIGDPAGEPSLGQVVERGLEPLPRVLEALDGVDEAPHLLRRRPHGRTGELVRHRRRHAVDELVRLVDDEDVVLGQEVAPLEGVDRHEGVVGDDDVDVPGGLAGPLDEALGDHRGSAARGTRRR